MNSPWQQCGADWWFTNFSSLSDEDLLHERALRGRWQIASYETKDFSGVMLLANPSAGAPAIRIPLPVRGRYSIAVGMPENYSDRLLIKLERDRCFEKLAHEKVESPHQAIQECWWKDADLIEGDALVLKQDDCMSRRCGVAYLRLNPAPPPTRPEFPFIEFMDGFPGKNGPISIDEMLGEELQFRDTQVTDLCHGTDLCGAAQYNTNLPSHRYPADRFNEEECISTEFYSWTLQQLLKFEKAGRCTLRESIEAAHSIGRKFYAYHRMSITRLYAPMRMFSCPFYDQHPEWRCVDWDRTPISRLSIAYPEVRRYFLEHLQETVERGADGVCLVFARGWPLILFEKPVADEFRKKTGREIQSADPEHPDLARIRIDIFNEFMREVRKAVNQAGKGRDMKIVIVPLALPAINLHYAMDCAAWAKEGLVQVLCPYPHGYQAEHCDINVPEWVSVLKGTDAILCPILNRGVAKKPEALLDCVEKWIDEGADGLSIWDLNSKLSLPLYRRLAYHVASKEGRRRLREMLPGWPVRHLLKNVDDIVVDRFHPGWNI